MVFKLSPICKTSPFLCHHTQKSKFQGWVWKYEKQMTHLQEGPIQACRATCPGQLGKSTSLMLWRFPQASTGSLFWWRPCSTPPAWTGSYLLCPVVVTALCTFQPVSLFYSLSLMRWETWAKGPWPLLWECLVRTYLTRPGGLSSLIFEKTWRGLFYLGYHSSFLQHLGSRGA